MTSDVSDRVHLKHVLLVIALAAVYRSVFVPIFPMGPDECLYWDWAQRLDLSYVEHPPMVAYAIAAMTALFGDTRWASRVLAVPLAAAASLLLFGAGRRLFDSRVGFWAATLHAVCPMFSMAGGVMLLPESLLGFWVTLAIYLAARLVTGGDLRTFYALGIVAGLGLLSKYPAVLILASLGLFALCSRAHRFWFRRKEPYLMVLIALLLFSPVIVWNVQHHGAGLGFIASRTALAGAGPSITRGLESFTAQAGYHSPVTFLLLWYGVGVAAWRGFGRRDDGSLLLFCFSGPVIVAFLVVACFRYTLPHWPAAGYLAAYIAAPAALLREPSSTVRQARRRRAVLWVAAICGALECAAMPILLVYPLTTLAYSRLRNVLSLPEEVVEPMAEAYGWDGVVRDRILSIRDDIIARTGVEPVVMTHYHMLAGLLAYSLRDTCEVVSLHAMARQYDIWFDDDDVIGKTVIYVSSENSSDFKGEPDDFYTFEQCTPEPVLPIIAQGIVINKVHIWVCEGYSGPAKTHGKIR